MENLQFTFSCFGILAVLLFNLSIITADDEGEDFLGVCNAQTQKCNAAKGLACNPVGTTKAVSMCECPSGKFWDATQSRCIDQIDDGEPCTMCRAPPCIPCKVRCKSGVSRRDHCECSDKSKYFDAQTKTCVPFVAKGATCSLPKQCGDHMTCDQTKCACDADSFDGTNNDCLKKKSVDEDATDVKQCLPTLELVDDGKGNKQCRCGANQMWVPIEKKCMDKLKPGDECTRFSPCKCHKKKCMCSDPEKQYFDGTQCQDRKEPDQSCEKDHQCVPDAECLQKVCKCTEGYVKDGTTCKRIPFSRICGEKIMSSDPKAVKLAVGQTLKDVCGSMQVEQDVTGVQISVKFGTALDDSTQAPASIFGSDLPSISSIPTGKYDFIDTTPIVKQRSGSGVLTFRIVWTESSKTYTAEASVDAYFPIDNSGKDVEIKVTKQKTTKPTINPRGTLNELLGAVGDNANIEIKLETADGLEKTTLESPHMIGVAIRPGPKPTTTCYDSDPKTRPPNLTLRDRTMGFTVFTDALAAGTPKVFSQFEEAKTGTVTCKGEGHVAFIYDPMLIDDDKNKCNNFHFINVDLDCGSTGPGDDEQDFFGLPMNAGLQGYVRHYGAFYSYNALDKSFTDLSTDPMSMRGFAGLWAYRGYLGKMIKPEQKMCKLAMENVKSFFSGNDWNFKNGKIQSALENMGEKGFVETDLEAIKDEIATPEDVGAYRALKSMGLPRAFAKVMGELMHKEGIKAFMIGAREIIRHIKMYAETSKISPDIKIKIREFLAMQKAFLVSIRNSDDGSMLMGALERLLAEVEAAVTNPLSTSKILSTKCLTKVDLLLAMLDIALEHDMAIPVPEDKMEICETLFLMRAVAGGHGWVKDVDKMADANKDGCGRETGITQFFNAMPLRYFEKDGKLFVAALNLMDGNSFAARLICLRNCQSGDTTKAT